MFAEHFMGHDRNRRTGAACRDRDDLVVQQRCGKAEGDDPSGCERTEKRPRLIWPGIAMSSAGTAMSPAAAKVKPPIHVELSKPAAARGPSVAIPSISTMRQLRHQEHRDHDRGRRHDVLWHPRRLEQPAGKTGRTRQHGIDIFRAEQLPQQVAPGCGRSE